MNSLLEKYGWNSFFENQITEQKDLLPARVIQEQKNIYHIITENGEFSAKLSDKLWFNSFTRKELPAVGDWILYRLDESENLLIEEVLERKTLISRKEVKATGRKYEKDNTSDEQVIAANVDIVFIVIAFDRDYNLRKIERYLTMVYDSGCKPVIVLNKLDYDEDYFEKMIEVQSISFGIDVIATSATNETNLDQLEAFIREGQTIAFIGSSGVGKSTIINKLSHEEKMVINDVRDGDNRGKHTTTHREMILLPAGGILIDNPGMKEIKFVATTASLDFVFQDVINLKTLCRFRNCSHSSEPDCAVRDAIENGTLSEDRLDNYHKIYEEVVKNKLRKDDKDVKIEIARTKQEKLGIKSKKHQKKRKSKWNKESKNNISIDMIYDSFAGI